jgi:DNA modification methylase
VVFKTEQLSDDVVIFNADCREVIPTLDKVDAVVVDPPYGIEEITKHYGRGMIRIHNDKNLNCTIDAFDLIQKKFDNIWLAAFYSSRISPVFFEAMKSFKYFGEVIWNKRTIGLGTAIRYQHENVAFFTLGQPPELKSISSVQTFTRLSYDRKRTVHPHEKPDSLMYNLCDAIPGKIILDPFCGTGSTGVAAAQLRRGFVGIEYDPKFYDLARKKIGEALKQPFNFWEEEATCCDAR